MDHSERGTFLPALRFHALTRFYDPITAATLRQRTLTRRLAELAAPRAGANVLDVGCGTATVALELARREPRASISGIDADDAMLDRARAKAADAGVELDLRTAMAQELPFPDDTFDVAVSSLFFHHLLRDDKLAVLAEVRRVLRPGARFAVADWGAPRDPIMWLASKSIRWLDGAETTADNLAGRLPAILQEAGFDEVRERDALRTPYGLMVFVTGSA